MQDKQQIVVMSVAGFDPSAGAGVLADIKTMSAFGCYGIAA
ncbi:MAG TPA: bifunctional hydroxymethylpyrimidine kinase/phosphomethylpyrimidine kinase, partial [Blastocatellia bacterium]